MENKELSETIDDQESTNETTKCGPNATDDNKRVSNVETRDGAGPSSTIPLPGAVQQIIKTCPLIAGLSKSEHDLRHVFTRQDVANALKMTSISFGPNTQGNKKVNLKDMNVPVQLNKNEGSEKDDATNLIDLKKFMASCFKFNKEGILINSANAEAQNITAVKAMPNEVIHEVPHTSCVALAQTESTVINIPNEIIITGSVDTKISKTGTEKKKTSGNPSERSDLGLTQRDSLSSIESNVCRICMTRGRERLISPCNCKGSLANVHLTCLERWLNQVGRNHCELCGFSYPAIRTPRYTMLQALRLWFGIPRNRSHLQSDCIIFWLLSTVTAGLLAICIAGTQYFVIEGNKFGKDGTRKEEGISHRITETAMDFFMAIVLCGYSVTVYLLWKDHYVMWNRWRRANVNVRLLLSPDANPVPFVPRTRYNIV